MKEIDIINSIVFYGFAGLILLFSVLSVFANRILYSLLFAVIAFFCTAGIFFSLGADYNAVIQIALYGVAVPVLFLFAIMFTSRKENKTVYFSFSPKFFIALVSAALLFMILWYSIKFAIYLNKNVTDFFTIKTLETSGFDSIVAIANGLYIDYRFSFVIFSFLVLSTIVGISVLNIIRERKHGQ